MITINADALREQIRDYWHGEFAGEIRGAQDYLEECRAAADTVRERLAGEEKRKSELAQVIQEQHNIIGGCQFRRKMHPGRLEEAYRRVEQAEHEVVDAAQRAQKSEEEESYLRRRRDEIEDLRPVDTTDYEGRVEAYNRRVKLFDEEIADLEQQYRAAKNAAADDESQLPVVQHLGLKLEDLRRDRRTLEVPQESQSFRLQLRQYEERLGEVKSKHATALVAMHDASEELNNSRSSLDYYRRELEKLESQPERDTKAEANARAALSEYEKELSSLRPAPSMEERARLQAEAQAEANLAAVTARRDAAIQKSFLELEHEPRKVQLETLATLTSRRDAAADLWSRAVEAERQFIADDLVPELAPAKQRLEDAKKRLQARNQGIIENYGSLQLSREELDALEKAFTPGERATLQSGSEITYIENPGCMGHFLPVFFGGLAGLCAATGLLHLWSPTGDVSDGAKRLAMLLVIVLAIGGVWLATAVWGRLFWRQKVSLQPDEYGAPKVKDSGYKYGLYNKALDHQRELREREALLHEVNQLNDTWARHNKAATNHAERLLSDSATVVPLRTGDKLDAQVAAWNDTLLKAAVGTVEWPTFDFFPLQARKRYDSPAYNNAWQGWVARLRKHGLGAFVDEL